MSSTLPFASQKLRRFVFGAVSVLAIAPMLYFAACSSGGDNGGGGGTTPPPSQSGGGSTANQFAYVIASGASEIQAYSLDNSGDLTKIGGPIATGIDPHHVDVDRAGRFVYVSNHDSSFVSGWRINTDGSLDPINSALGSPVLTADVGPHSSIIDQTGNFLYVVAGTGASNLTAYTIDTSTGSTRGQPTAIAGQSFPVGTHGHNVTISPNNQFVYVAAEGSGEVFAFSRDTTTGVLTPQGSVNNLPTCDAVVVSPDNKFLYAAYTNAVEVFSIGANGALTRITPVSAFSTNNNGQGSGPHSMTIHPNGQTLYTANINANTVSIFRVDTNTGALTELPPPPATGISPNYVLIHPNQLFLYTADQVPGALSRFAINADGTLVTPATVIPNTGVGTNGIGTTKF